MAQAEVRDRMLWTNHVHGDDELARRLAALPRGKIVRMRIAGRSGVWQKVNAAALRPIGETKAWWREVYGTKRGKLVDVVLDEPASHWPSANDAERDAAWAAFKALARAGWRSEAGAAAGAQRDDLHER